MLFGGAAGDGVHQRARITAKRYIEQAVFLPQGLHQQMRKMPGHRIGKAWRELRNIGLLLDIDPARGRLVAIDHIAFALKANGIARIVSAIGGKIWRNEKQSLGRT